MYVHVQHVYVYVQHVYVYVQHVYVCMHIYINTYIPTYPCKTGLCTTNIGDIWIHLWGIWARNGFIEKLDSRNISLGIGLYNHILDISTTVKQGIPTWETCSPAADFSGCGLRLYPISSSRMGDDERSKTLSIYVESQGRRWRSIWPKSKDVLLKMPFEKGTW